MKTLPRGTPLVSTAIAWMLPLALTALVIVLAWKLYQSTPKGINDADAVSRLLERLGGDDDIVLVGHSYGGAVISQAMAGSRAYQPRSR